MTPRLVQKIRAEGRGLSRRLCSGPPPRLSQAEAKLTTEIGPYRTRAIDDEIARLRRENDELLELLKMRRPARAVEVLSRLTVHLGMSVAVYAAVAGMLHDYYLPMLFTFILAVNGVVGVTYASAPK